MKTCNKCKEEKPLDEFYKAKRLAHGRTGSCKQCLSVLHKQIRLDRLDHYTTVNQAGKTRKRRKLDEYKSTLSCSLCSEDDPVALDFHHLDPTQKEFSIAAGTINKPWVEVLAEIDKCIVLCSNCHRKVHANKIILLP